MNKKIIVFIGVVILGLAFVLFGLNKNKSTDKANQSLQADLKDEVSVGNNVCEEFPKEWVSLVLGKTIIKTASLDSTVTYVCEYYVDESNFVTLRLNNLSVENQKKGQVSFGRTITTNPSIKMDHFVVIQEDGLINGVYLIINPNLFMAVDRTSTKAASEEELVSFAGKVAERIQSGENVTSKVPSSQAVPVLKGEDIVRNFFSLIDEGKIEEAVEMMAPRVISSDSDKQAWGVQFNAFEKITVKKIEPTVENTYQVTLDVEMKPESENGPIPFYGYDQGENIRWVSLEQVDNVWRVTQIATSP